MTASIYAWDAVNGTLDTPNQGIATYVRTHLQNSNTQAEFAATVAVAQAQASDPTYNMTDPFGPTQQNVQIPNGTVAGGSSDHHVVFLQPNGDRVGCWLYNAATHQAQGIGRVVHGGVSETRPSSGSNAAWVDNYLGLIRPSDLTSGIPKTLLFGTPTTAVNNNISRYPANAQFNDPNCPYGTWLRLDPNGTVPNYGGDPLLQYIDLCLRQCGMICRDQSQGGLVIWGQDMINQTGDNVAAWAAAGVTLNLQGAQDSYKIGRYLSTLLPWSQLQVLQAPPTNLGGSGGGTGNYLGEVITGGVAVAPGGGSGATSQAMTINNAPGGGALITALLSPTNWGISSVADSKGNTWRKADAKLNTTDAELWYTIQDVGTLVNGDLITPTFLGTVFNLAALVEAFASPTGAWVSPDPLDVHINANATLTARDGGTTAALAQANELAVGAFAIGGGVAETAFTPGTGFAGFTTAFKGIGTATAIEGEYQFLSASTAVRAQGTGGGSGGSSGITATFKPATATVPSNTVAPVISGSPQVGQTLTVANGTWTGSPAPSTFTWQWQLETGVGTGVFANISGATNPTRVPVSTEIGRKVRCNVTAVNSAGSTTAPSNQLTVIAEQVGGGGTVAGGLGGWVRRQLRRAGRI